MGPKLRREETQARHRAMQRSFVERRDAGTRRSAAKSGLFALISGTGQEG